MLPTTENDYAVYHMSDDVLYITYKKGVILDLAAAIEVVKDRLLMHEGGIMPVLCDIRGLNGLNKSARSYLAKEGSVLIKAAAVLVDSPVSHTLSKFFMQTTNPPIPIKSFTDEHSALRFLSDFKD